jgi:hypothetical protein
MATVLWHPDAKKQIFSAKGKLWSGGSGKPKFLFHTTETTGFPKYSSPPHMTLDPLTGELRQHIPFNRAAYSVRSGKVDTMRFAYQIEVIGRAREVPMYRADPWYNEVAKLIQWFHDNLDVPLVFEDFSVVKFGQFAVQRRNYATVDDFSGILGHCHVGRGIDSHWDPGRLNVTMLQIILKKTPPPPSSEEDDMFLPLEFGDGYKDGTTLQHPDYKGGNEFVTDRRFKRSDVRAVQEMLRDAGGDLKLDGEYGPQTVEAMKAVLPTSAADSKGTIFHGNDWTPLLRKVIEATVPPPPTAGGDLSRGDVVKLT